MAKEVLELEVKSNIKSTTKDTEDLGKGLEEAGESGKKGFKKIGTGVKAFGMALKAAGIGLILALFASLTEALNRNQKVMNTVNTVMTTVSTTFNQVVDVLIDVFSWVTASQDRFDGLTKVITSLMTLALTPLKLSFYAIKLSVQGAMLAWEDSFLGGGDQGKIAELRSEIISTGEDIRQIGLDAISAGKDIYDNIGDAITEIGDIGSMVIDQISEISIKSNYEIAAATTAAQNSSKLAEAAIQGLIEKYDRQAELQRHIRDSEKATFAERITASEEIGKILKKQEKEMLALADTRVASALLERDANKDNIDLEVAYQQTLNDRAGVLAQITGFASEQKQNQESLEKELAETQREIAQDSIDGIDRELLELKNAYELKLDMARKANVSNLALTEQYLKEKQAIIDAAADEEIATAKAITDAKRASVNDQLSAAAGLAGALSSLAGDNKQLAVGSAIMDTYVGANKAYAQGGTVGFITAAAVIAAGLKNVQTILSTDVGDSGGGGLVAAAPQPPAPQMMSGAFELTGGQAVEPVQAYVVSDDITNNQNKLAIIRRRATI